MRSVSDCQCLEKRVAEVQDELNGSQQIKWIWEFQIITTKSLIENAHKLRIKDWNTSNLTTDYGKAKQGIYMTEAWQSEWVTNLHILIPNISRFYASRIHDWKYCSLQFGGGTLNHCNKHSMKTNMCAWTKTSV